MGLAPDRHALFGHRLQQRRLRARRRSVDLVCQKYVREDRPFLEVASLVPVVVTPDLNRADDVFRLQVRRELNTRKVQRQRLRERTHEQRLSEPRHALQQHVAARQHAHDHTVDDVAMPDDHLLDLVAQRLRQRRKLLDLRLGGGRTARFGHAVVFSSRDAMSARADELEIPSNIVAVSPGDPAPCP